MPQSALSRNSAWCNRAETVLIAGSIGSSVAAVVLQQVTFAAITSIQLSFVVGLGSWNRKRFDEVNQQNQAAITQLQQQHLSQGKNFVNQIKQAVQQLPTYKEIGDLQHHLERLEADHQKRIEQLHGEMRNQEEQLSQSAKELTSLQQSTELIPRIDLDSLQDRIHDLKAHFELKFRALENESNQFVIDQLNYRISQIEKTVAQLPSALEIKELSSQVSPVFQEIKDLKLQLISSTFDPKGLYAEIKALSINIQKLEAQIQKIEVDAINDVSPEVKKPEGEMEELLDFIQSEIDELDRRNQNLGHQVESLNNQLNDHRGVVLEKIQSSQVELKSHSLLIEKEIRNIYILIEDLNQKTKKKNPQSPPIDPKTICERCNKICKTVFVGGFLNNCNFCSRDCMREYERSQGIEGH